MRCEETIEELSSQEIKFKKNRRDKISLIELIFL